MEIRHIGIIGAGAVGSMLANGLASAGYSVSAFDIDSGKTAELRKNNKAVFVANAPHKVIRPGIEQLVVFCVQARSIKDAVSSFIDGAEADSAMVPPLLGAPFPHIQAPLLDPARVVISGETATKVHEAEAFERFRMPDRNLSVVPVHSLHMPPVMEGQHLVAIRGSSTSEHFAAVNAVFSKLYRPSKIGELESAEHHDKIASVKQGLVHLPYLSMMTAWSMAGQFPWLNPDETGGVDNIKAWIGKRIAGGKSHVYSDLATLNPFFPSKARQFASSTLELYQLSVAGNEKELRNRLGRCSAVMQRDEPIDLDDQVMGEFSLAKRPGDRPNSHLSLWALADTFVRLEINPYADPIFDTPPARLLRGVTEYLFRNGEMLEESIQTALHNKSLHREDAFFVGATAKWAGIVQSGSHLAYIKQFDDVRAFFSEETLKDAKIKSDMLIARLRSKTDRTTSEPHPE